jgi:hypothetical protein
MNGDIKAEWGHTSFAGISLKLRNVPDWNGGLKSALQLEG